MTLGPINTVIQSLFTPIRCCCNSFHHPLNSCFLMLFTCLPPTLLMMQLKWHAVDKADWNAFQAVHGQLKGDPFSQEVLNELDGHCGLAWFVHQCLAVQAHEKPKNLHLGISPRSCHGPETLKGMVMGNLCCNHCAGIQLDNFCKQTEHRATNSLHNAMTSARNYFFRKFMTLADDQLESGTRESCF